MAKRKVAEKVIDTKNMTQATINFQGFVDRVKNVYPDSEVTVIIKAKA
ncbi:hypothetical protein [Lysinibacillus sp. 54212]